MTKWTKTRLIVELVGAALWILGCLSISVTLFYKILWAADLRLSVAQDPLMLWVAAGMAQLLLLAPPIVIDNLRKKWNPDEDQDEEDDEETKADS